MVKTQAHTMRPAIPQRTAESRWTAPTPTIAPVIVCVVLTGMPARAVANKVMAPAVSAQNPPTGLSLVMRCPMVFTMRQPPKSHPVLLRAPSVRLFRGQHSRRPTAHDGATRPGKPPRLVGWHWHCALPKVDHVQRSPKEALATRAGPIKLDPCGVPTRDTCDASRKLHLFVDSC